MTYFDPRVYDPERLRGADRDVMRGYDLAVDEALDFLDNCADDAETGVEAFDEIYRQVVAQVRGDLEDRLDGSRIELTVSLMEDSPEGMAGEAGEEPPASPAMPSGMRAGLYGEWESKLSSVREEGSCADE